MKTAVINFMHAIGANIQAWMLKDLGYEVYMAGESFRPLVPNYHWNGKLNADFFAGVLEVKTIPPDALFVDTHPDTEHRLRSAGLRNPFMVMWLMPVGPDWVEQNYKPGINSGSLAFSWTVGKRIEEMGVSPNACFWPPYLINLDRSPREGFEEYLITLVENAAGWSNVGVLDGLRKHPRTKLELYGGGPPDWARKIPQQELFGRLRRSLAMYHLKPFDTPGFAVMEAALQGVPIIFPNDWVRLTGSSHLFEDGISCMIVETDVDKVVAVAEKLRDPEMNRHIGREGQRRVMDACDWRKHRPLLDQVLQSIHKGESHGSITRPERRGRHPALREAVDLAFKVMKSADDRPEWLKKETDEPEPNTFYYRFLWNLAKLRKPAVMVETGTYQGHSAAHLANGNPDGTVITIDKNASCRQALDAMGLPNVRFIHGDSLDTFKEVQRAAPHIDLLFLDSSMHFPHMLEEYKLYRSLVPNGGLIMVDDIHINPEMEQVWAGIHDEKAEVNGLHYKGFGISVKGD